MSIFSDVDAAPAARQTDPELIKLIGQRFISRKDVKAIERPDGAWNPVTDTGKADGKRLGFTMQDFTDHVEGRKTFGHYLLAPDDTCKLFAFDLDLDKKGWFLETEASGDTTVDVLKDGIHCDPRMIWAAQDPPEAVNYFTSALRGLADGLAHCIHRLSDGSVHPAIFDSGGKGLHVYGFTGVMPAEHVRDFARSVLMAFGIFEPTRGDNFWKHKAVTAYSNITIEVFPKQNTLDGKDLGNLMRLPLGINQRTGRRGRFINSKAQINRLIEMDPIRALSGDLPWE